MEKGRPTGVLFPIAGLLPTVEEIVPDIPPPAAAALVQTAEKLHIAAGGQPHQQRQAVFPSAQSQNIVSWRQKAEEHLPPAQYSAPAVTAPAGPQNHGVPRTEVLQDQTDAAQAASVVQAQGNIRLSTLTEAEAAGRLDAPVRLYCSNLALTRYSPPVTPPNRYLPASLVLVVAISSS